MTLRVYHFTPLEFGLSDLALRRVKIARLHELNDPFELLGIDLDDERIRIAVSRTKDQLSENRGVICFGLNWREPLMWSHYAGKHTGLCLGFDIPDEIAIHVTYSSERPKLVEEDFLGEATGMRNMSNLLSVKHDGWSYEREVRVYCRLDHNESENGLFFHEFVPELSLREVILGPLCRVPDSQVRRLVSSIGPDIIVRKTTLGRSTFEVVEADGI